MVSRRLPGLIRDAIEVQAERPPLPITGKVGTAKQRSLAVEVMRRSASRSTAVGSTRAIIRSPKACSGDVRVTTRFVPQEPFTGLMGVLHETGHAMYDLGLPEAWRDQPVGRDRGMALEESQSLLLEMIVGRSRPFMTYLRPLLEKHFGAAGRSGRWRTSTGTLTRVRRGPIRVDADELTYPCTSCCASTWRSSILPARSRCATCPTPGTAAWSERLGAAARTTLPKAACRTCTGRVGSFGYFPSYALGASSPRNCTRACARPAETSTSELAAGRFGGLLGWLRENVHGARRERAGAGTDAAGDRPAAGRGRRCCATSERKYLEDGAVSTQRADVPAATAAAPAPPRTHDPRR